MTCPFCTETGTKILVGSWDDDRKTIRRDRLCTKCGYTWTTVELDIDQVEKLEGAVNGILRGLHSEGDTEFIEEDSEP